MNSLCLLFFLSFFLSFFVSISTITFHNVHHSHCSFLAFTDFIFTVTGLFSFFLVFIIPSVFQIVSRYFMLKRYGSGSDVTAYSGFSSGNKWVYASLIVGLSAFNFAVGDLIWNSPLASTSGAVATALVAITCMTAYEWYRRKQAAQRA